MIRLISLSIFDFKPTRLIFHMEHLASQSRRPAAGLRIFTACTWRHYAMATSRFSTSRRRRTGMQSAMGQCQANLATYTFPPYLSFIIPCRPQTSYPDSSSFVCITTWCWFDDKIGTNIMMCSWASNHPPAPSTHPPRPSEVRSTWTQSCQPIATPLAIRKKNWEL